MSTARNPFLRPSSLGHASDPAWPCWLGGDPARQGASVPSFGSTADEFENVVAQCGGTRICVQLQWWRDFCQKAQLKELVSPRGCEPLLCQSQRISEFIDYTSVGLLSHLSHLIHFTACKHKPLTKAWDKKGLGMWWVWFLVQTILKCTPTFIATVRLCFKVNGEEGMCVFAWCLWRGNTWPVALVGEVFSTFFSF